MKSFKKYMESFESEMTGSNIVMICNKLKENGSNPSDAGYLVVADILESLGNDMKADTIRMAMSSSYNVYSEGAASLIAESGSEGFVSLEGMTIKEQLSQNPYAQLSMSVDKVTNVKEIFKRYYPHLNAERVSCQFHFSKTVVDAAKEKHMGVEQYLLDKNLNSESFDFMHPKWERMMQIDGIAYGPIQDGHQTILEAFRDHCGTDVIFVRRYSRGSFVVQSDIESYGDLVDTYNGYIKASRWLGEGV